MVYKKSVLFTSYLDIKALNSVYGAAKAMVYPSFFEGFGIPLIEAMKVGCPVITSYVTSLPEIGLDAVLYVNPLDTNTITEAMLKIENTALTNTLIQKGYQQAKKFTWEKTADALWKTVVKVIQHL